MKLAFAGGGTGGHLAPAIALLEELRTRQDNSPALFLTAGRPARWLEKTVSGCRVASIPAASFTPRRWWTMPRSGLRNLRGYRRASVELAAFSPDLVIGLGGYVAVPPVLAAHRLHIPAVLHEQNVVMGRANRFLSRYSSRVICSYPVPSAGDIPGILPGIGFPVRSIARVEAGEGTLDEWGLAPGRFTVLVLGGSRGARPVNRLLEETVRRRAIPACCAQFIHCAGTEDVEKLISAYRQGGLTSAVFAELDEIGRAYSLADLVIGRAGGATLSEIACWGLPSILIPYPWATDDHQLANARYFQNAGAALVYEQAEVSPPLLVEQIRRLSGDQEERKKMTRAARGLALPGAAAKMIGIFEEVIREKQ